VQIHPENEIAEKQSKLGAQSCRETKQAWGTITLKVKVAKQRHTESFAQTTTEDAQLSPPMV